MTSEEKFKKEHELYLLDINKEISYEDFMRPNKFKKFHEDNVGSVVKGIKENLKIYPHFVRFDHMFFYRQMTDDEIHNGPIVFELNGQACIL